MADYNSAHTGPEIDAAVTAVKNKESTWDGKVPGTRTVSGKPLSADVTLNAADVGAVPTSRKVNNKALSADISLAAGDVGAVPTSRKVNNKALSADISLTASDVGAAPAYTYGTTDLTAGTSELATGTLYFFYE